MSDKGPWQLSQLRDANTISGGMFVFLLITHQTLKRQSQQRLYAVGSGADDTLIVLSDLPN